MTYTRPSGSHLDRVLLHHISQPGTSTKSQTQVAEIIEILNRLGEKVDEKSKAKMQSHFANACKYEYLFWDIAYNLRS